MKKVKKTGRRSVSLRLATYERLNKHCRETSTTMSGLVERLIADYFTGSSNSKPRSQKDPAPEPKATTDPIRGGGTHLL